MRRQAVVERDWILNKPIENFITETVNLNRSQASQLVSLLKQGKETAYIARYREDVHGGLSPADVRSAYEAYLEAIDLNSKVSSALTTVIAKVPGAQEKEVVGSRLRHCEDVLEVTEISKEFASGSRKTKANIARELGMEKPAREIFDAGFVDFQKLTSGKMKSVKEVEEHLKICLADLINREEEVKRVAMKMGKLETKSRIRVTAKLTKEASKKKDDRSMEKSLEKYKFYIGNDWGADHIKDHQICALNRGSEEGILSWKVDLAEQEALRQHPLSRKRVHSKHQSFYMDALKYSISNYFTPKVERAVRRFLNDRSANRSINLFGENVEELFAQQGVQSKYVIALDPGYNSIKTAFLKPSGEVISMDEFGIRDSNFDGKGVALLKKWSRQTEGADLVFAIGNGSNSYKTQKAVSKMIEFGDFPEEIDVCFCVVGEHGASKYSCTQAAIEEFGEKAQIKQISAVSIGRRLIDPMSEYVKIEPQHLGKGQYQLSMDEKELKRKLSNVVRDRVSLIGTDLNKASKHLLEQICGLNETKAAAIVKYRDENGGFRNRQELKKVKGIGEVAFQQCAGFLTIAGPKEEGPPAKRAKKSSVAYQPLDGTTVHPDDYEAAERLLSRLGITVEEVVDGKRVPDGEMDEQEKKLFDLIALKPMLKPPPQMMKKVKSWSDVSPGQKFTGTVSNRTDFGVFVDIGVEKDGLIHKSHYDHPGSEMPTVGDVIEVTIRNLTRDGKIQLAPVNR